MGKEPKVYALYGGEAHDEFIDVGTARELAERHGTTPDSIRWLSYPSARKRNSKVLAFRIEEGDIR